MTRITGAVLVAAPSDVPEAIEDGSGGHIDFAADREHGDAFVVRN